MPPRNWKLRIEDILQAIARIERYTANTSYDTFGANEMIIDAVIRNLIIIGEATRHIPQEYRRSIRMFPGPICVGSVT